MYTTRSKTNQMIRRSEATNLTTFYSLTDKVKKTIPKKNNTQTHNELIRISIDYASCDNEDTDSIASEDSEISEFGIDIDFDDAHDEWCSNKKRGPNGTYVYLCCKPLGNNKKCKYTSCDKIGLYSGCKRHYMWEEKQHKLEDCILWASEASPFSAHSNWDLNSSSDNTLGS